MQGLGREDEALTAFERALATGDSDAALWNDKGSALLRLGRAGDALEAYKHVVDIAPDNWYSWRGIATTLKSLGRDEEALDAARHALSLRIAQSRFPLRSIIARLIYHNASAMKATTD